MTDDGQQMLDHKSCLVITYPWAICSLTTYLVPFIVMVSFVHKQPILNIIAQPKLFMMIARGTTQRFYQTIFGVFYLLCLVKCHVI